VVIAFRPNSWQVCSFCGRDLWEVSRYVSAGPVAVCDSCVELARQVLTEAGADSGPEFHLPPRIFGDVPEPEAVEDIQASFRAVFGLDAAGPEELHRYLEDAEELIPYREEAGRRNPIRPSAPTRIERIRFPDDDNAQVRFQIGLAGGGTPSFEGRATRVGGRWLVTRETVVDVLRQGGVQVPPRPV
jgi:hypothetical protein